MKILKYYILLTTIFIIYVEYSVGNILFRPNEHGNLVLNIGSLLHYLTHPLYNKFLWNIQLLDVNYIFWSILYFSIYLKYIKKNILKI